MNRPETRGDRDARFTLRHSPEVIVTIQSDDLTEELKTYRARLFDLSERGAKLVSGEPISADQSIRLCLAVKQLGLDFHIAAEVCWSKPGVDGTSVFGCSFNPALPQGVFHALAKGREVGRRFDPRQKCSQPIEGLWEVNGKIAPVTLEDHSRGGFCVRSSQPGEAGGRFRLQLRAPHAITLVAKSLWVLKVADAYLVGCGFVNARDFARLDEAVNSHDPTDPPRPVLNP